MLESAGNRKEKPTKDNTEKDGDQNLQEKSG